MNPKRLRRETGSFIRQYGRRRHASHDPNDRRYGRKLERAVKQLRPEELDRVLRDEEDED